MINYGIIVNGIEGEIRRIINQGKSMHPKVSVPKRMYWVGEATGKAVPQKID